MTAASKSCPDKPISLTSKNLSSDFRKTQSNSGPTALRYFYSPSQAHTKVVLTLQVDKYLLSN